MCRISTDHESLTMMANQKLHGETLFQPGDRGLQWLIVQLHGELLKAGPGCTPGRATVAGCTTPQRIQPGSQITAGLSGVASVWNIIPEQ